MDFEDPSSSIKVTRVREEGRLGKKCIEQHEKNQFYPIGIIAGEGTFKIAKFALKFDQQTRQLFIRTTAPSKKFIKLHPDPQQYQKVMHNFTKEVELLNLFRGEKEFVQIIFSYVRRSKHGYSKQISMLEYCNKGDLSDFLKTFSREQRTQNEEKLISIFHDILLGLIKMEEKGVIHKDLKFENIFLKEEGGRLHAKIGDFGLASRKDEECTKLSGTPAYISPEMFAQVKNRSQSGLKHDPQNDIWAVGMMIYKVVYGSSFYENLNKLKHPRNPEPINTGRIFLLSQQIHHRDILHMCDLDP